MNFSKLKKLPTLQIEKPCPEDWEAMEGTDQKRFCQGCACFVHNLSAMSADEAESVLHQSGRVCVRMKLDGQNGIRVRDGWIPRLLAIGALAAGAVGCAEPGINQGEVTGSVAPQTESNNYQMGDVATPAMMGKIASPRKGASKGSASDRNTNHR